VIVYTLWVSSTFSQTTEFYLVKVKIFFHILFILLREFIRFSSSILLAKFSNFFVNFSNFFNLPLCSLFVPKGFKIYFFLDSWSGYLFISNRFFSKVLFSNCFSTELIVLKNCSFADLIVRLRPIVFLLNFFQIEIEKKNQFTKENPKG
jgi:hypothetical protein